MRADDIHDETSLIAWLEARPEQRRRYDAVAIAQRSAMRVLPLWLRDLDHPALRSIRLNPQILLRCLLTAAVSFHQRSPEIMSAARLAAASAALSFTDSRASTKVDPVLAALAELEVKRLREALASAGSSPPDGRVVRTGTDGSGAQMYARIVAATSTATEAINAAETISSSEATFLAASAAARAATAYGIANMGTEGIWETTWSDARILEANEDVFSFPLWHTTFNAELADAESLGLELLSRETGDRNSFWHRWWFAMKRGEPMDWALQRDVALIPEDIWAKGAKAVGVEIAKIEARYKRPPPADVLDLAHTDFTYDALRQWMRMVPFEQDISRLRDPVVLGRLQDASGDLRTVLETLQTAAEAAGRQSANEVKVIADQIFRELDRVTSHQELRVGVLIDLGETLQFASGNEDIRMGLGPILPRLMDRASDRLLDLLRAYFAPSMVRTAPLREIVLHADESPRAIVDMARKTLAILQDYDGSVIPPLNPEDLEVLEHLNDALARAWLLFEAANSTEIKVELGNSFARKAFQLAVDKARYVKRGYDQVNAAIGGKDNDTADAMLRRIQLFHTATEIGQWLLELLKLMTGG